MSGYELREKVFPLEEGLGVDDICDKIKALAGLPFVIETILITKTHIKAQIWTQVNTEPPEGDLPPEDVSSLRGLLKEIAIREVEPGDVNLNLGALAVVTDMLLQCRAVEMAGVAWIVGDLETFTKWLGISKPPIRFLELPIFPYDEFSADKVVLLCARSADNHVFQSRLGITATIVMEDQDADM